MSMVNVKRECEIKYPITSISEELNLIEKIQKLGFIFKSSNLESDYVPDVNGFLCRKNGIMLRFRVLEGSDNDVLLTLKIKGKEEGFQDNYEIETLFSDFDENNFNKINEVLYNVTDYKLPVEIVNLRKISEIRKYLRNSSFLQHRMFIQKKRKEYILENKKITIDEFPGEIGKFLEIETNTPEELFRISESLELNRDKIETRNYGEIIKEKQKDLPENKRRICIFED